MTSSINLTPEQVLIIEAVRSSRENLIISAYAGAAKTTTLVLACEALPGTPILSLAFNKKTAVEMEKRLPSHVKSSTLNALGHGIWASACAKRLTLDTDKTYKSVQKIISELPKSVRGDYLKDLANILQACRSAKAAGYIPEGKYPHTKSLVSAEDFFSDLDDEVPQDIVDGVLIDSITQAYAGTIDFDDQIYMPTLFGGTFPLFPVTCVDEAQDLSPLNHEMLAKLVCARRLIIVGDKYQSIYGFRGAAQSGMDVLRTRFAMRELKLSTSFRCPKQVVYLARERVPDMQYPDWAEDGKVTHVDFWSHSLIPDGGVVLCRNNAPLLALGFALIKRGRGINLVGMDIGPRLIKLLQKFGPANTPRAQVESAIVDWQAGELRKRPRKAKSINDRADCLTIFAAQGDTLSAAIAYAEHLFADKGPVLLMSGHKAKGLEFDHVFHLDPWRVKTKDREGNFDEQEANVGYVITTRAKKTLTMFNLEDMQ